MKKTIKQKYKIDIRKNKHGFSLWVQENKMWHWVLDCSTFKKDFEVTICDKTENNLWKIFLEKQKRMRWERETVFKLKTKNEKND